MRPRWWWVLAAFLLGSAGSLSSVSPAMALASPEVGYEAASNVSTTSATIAVPINPEGGETRWEIWLECQGAQGGLQSGCGALTVGEQREEGVLAPGSEKEIVSDHVTGLQPDYLYRYDVIASNSAGREGYLGGGFVTCPSQGSCPSQPFLIGESLWVMEGAERAGREASQHEAEWEAAKKEAEERLAKEAAERAAKEREIREAGERTGREDAERAAAERAPKCVVPRLKGDSLARARRVLTKASCHVGKLIKPHGYYGPLVVIGQSIRSGSKLARGTKVALTLGRSKAE